MRPARKRPTFWKGDKTHRSTRKPRGPQRRGDLQAESIKEGFPKEVPASLRDKQEVGRQRRGEHEHGPGSGTATRPGTVESSGLCGGGLQCSHLGRVRGACIYLWEGACIYLRTEQNVKEKGAAVGIFIHFHSKLKTLASQVH